MTSETSEASLDIIFDPLSGAASSTFTQFKKLIDGTSSETEISEGDIQVDSYLQSLNLSSGNYLFDYCSTEKANLDDDINDSTFKGECHDTEYRYLHFDEADASSYPEVSIWHSKTTREQCYQDDQLVYQFSDGEKSWSIADSELTFSEMSPDALLEAILANGWAPSKALENFKLNKLDFREEHWEGQKDHRNRLAALYGFDFCNAKIDDYVDSWLTGTVVEEELGVFKCENVTWTLEDEYGNYKYENHPEDEIYYHCANYQLAKSEAERTRILAKLKGDCKLWEDFTPVETNTLYAGKSLVDKFLSAFGDLRHGSGPSRVERLAEAYHKIDLDILDAANDNQDDKLVAMAREWAAIEDHVGYREILEKIKPPLSTVVTDLPSDFNNKTGRAIMVELLTTDTYAKDALEEKVCEGQYLKTLSPALSLAEVDTYLSQIVFVHDSPYAEFKTGTSNTKQLTLDFLTAIKPSFNSCVQKTITTTLHDLGHDYYTAEKWVQWHHWVLSPAKAAIELDKIYATLFDPNQDGKQLVVPATMTFNESMTDAEILADLTTLDSQVDVFVERLGYHFTWLRNNIDKYVLKDEYSKKLQLLEMTKSMMSQIAHSAFTYDAAFANVYNSLLTNSKCAMDASAASYAYLDSDENLNYPIIVRSPIYRQMGGPITPALSIEVTSTQSYQVMDTRFSYSGDLNACYWGNVVHFNRLSFTEDGFDGTLTNAWVNTCDQSSEDGVNYIDYGFIKMELED